MANSEFDRETLLDISVNIVPLVIILFFAGLLVAAPFPSNLFVEAIALGLHVVPFVLLALLTYIAAQYLGGE